MASTFPKVKFVVSEIDPDLNAQCHIEPGIGAPFRRAWRCWPSQRTDAHLRLFLEYHALQETLATDSTELSN